MISRYWPVWLFFLFMYSFASADNTDSLLQALDNAVTTHERVTVLLGLSRTHELNKMPQKALDYATEAYEIIQQEDVSNDSLKAKALFLIGYAHMSMDEYAMAVEYYTKSIPVAKKAGIQELLIFANGELGLIYSEKGIYDKALQYTQIALTIAEETKDTVALSAAFTNIATLYQGVGDMEKAEKYLLLSYAMCDRIDDPEGQAYNLGNLGILYYEQGDVKKGLEYYKKALYVFDSLKIDEGTVMALWNVGEVYFEMDSLTQAWKYTYKAYLMSKQQGLMENRVVTALGLARIKKTEKDYVAATQYAEEALLLAKAGSSKMDMIDVYEYLMEAAEEMGNFEQALEYRKQYDIARDSFIEQEKARAFTEMTFKFETEKKEAENQFLKEEHKRNKTIIAQRTAIAIFSGLALLLSGILAWFFFKRKHRYSLQLEKEVDERTRSLQKSNTSLLRKNEALESFAYITSHDLREPILNISTFSDLLKSEIKKGETENNIKYLNIIKSRAEFMNNLIKSIMSYTEAAVKTPKIEKTNICEAIEMAKANLTTYIDKKNAIVKNNCKMKVQNVCFPPMQLTTVFQNLIQNGIKYNKADSPVIYITCAENEQGVQFAISDNGVGIDTEFQQQIFQPFKTMENKFKVGGTGLGLTICRTIIENNGGKIWVENREEGGSVFYFTVNKERSKNNLSI